jgi:peptidoglycan-N-acetylglucosamine deacetylase
MKNPARVVRCFACLLFTSMPVLCAAQKLAITFDDLPQNGDLPPGVTRVEITRSTLAILKKLHVPATYGFINAKKLEGSSDGAEALKLWAAEEPLANHTYSHLDLNQNTPEAFEREIAENEPVLELLKPSTGSAAASSENDWHWLRYPFLREGDTIEKRNAVRDYLKAHGYKIAQVTMDWEDYLWNSAYARCSANNDQKSIEWLRASYLDTASKYIDLNRELSKMLFGRDINYVLLMHLGSFSSTILPNALDLLKKKGFTLVTLQEAQSDPVYEIDPAAGSLNGGTLLDQLMDARKIKYPTMAEKPRKELQNICQ